MMADSEIIAALTPFFDVIGKRPDPSQWSQYTETLAHVNPGDLDDAMASLRRTHAFRALPMPADIFSRCEDARKSRIQPEPDWAPIKTGDGVENVFTLEGIGSIRMRVLPDDHPALRRYACLTCLDTGMEDVTPPNAMNQPTYRQCACRLTNPVLQEQRRRMAERKR